MTGQSKGLMQAVAKVADLKCKILMVLLIFAIFCDIIFIQIIAGAFTGNANLIAQAVVLMIQQDDEVLDTLGVDKDKADWDFTDWFTGGNKSSGWVVDKNLLVRQKTLYIFEKATEGTFFADMPYAVYGTGLCEAGFTAWYDYDGIQVSDADPIINLVGTGKSYNQQQATDTSLWIFKNDGQTPAVSPFQFVGVYGPNKMRYQVDMDYEGKFETKDLLANSAVDIGDKQDDEVEFARPNPLYIPDASYSYSHGLDATYATKDLSAWCPDIQTLNTTNQTLMRAQIAFCLYGWGEGNVTGKYEKSGHSLKTFSAALSKWLKEGNTIADIVDYTQYWDSQSLKIVGYNKEVLKKWCEDNLGITLTKESTQGTYVEMEGLYHIILGYIEWMNLEDMIEVAEKQGGGDGDASEGLGDLAGRQRVIEVAKNSLGKFTYANPNSLRGTGPNDFTVGTELDCSGWVQWCYWSAGYTFEAGNTRHYAGAGDLTEITADQVQIADLQVVYPDDSDNGTGHVWMYMGDGVWGECTPKGGTRADNWQKNFMTRNPSHYFQYTAFLTSSGDGSGGSGGSGGQAGGSSGNTGNWQNPVPGYKYCSRRFYDGGVVHGAIDIAAAEWTPIYAQAAGTVVAVKQNWVLEVDGKQSTASYGNYVNIEHGNGVWTFYAHMVQQVATVGQQVNAGDLIGYVGNTGNQFGAHCHFEVRLGSNRSGARSDPDNAALMAQYGLPCFTSVIP